MANKILVARGTKARIEEIKSTLTVNELVYSTDTGELGVKKSDGNIEYFMNAADINAKVDPNAMAYFDYAGSVYGDKYSLLPNAWEHSLIVDPSEISANSTTSNNRGKAQYPNGETEGVIIPQGVTTIGGFAFYNWKANNQPLVIPNSVTSIGGAAFGNWSSNKQPLIIPNSVTSIDSNAFNGWSLVPYVEIRATTPPTLVNISAFGEQNNAPIYVPDESVDDYKTATNWVDLADRIFPISDKVDLMDNIEGLKLDIQTIEQSVDGLENNKVDKVSGKGLSTNDLTNTLKTNYDNAYTHSQSTHAPSNAQKNSDITKAEIEAKLTGQITTHNHDDRYYTETEIDTKLAGKANATHTHTKSQISDLIEATQALSGLMSATDKTRLDVLHALLEEDTSNNVVDSINEVLAIFNNYPEGADLVSALAGKVDKVTGKGLSTNDLTNTLKTNYDNAYTHSQSTHAPSNAQKNSDITKAEIEAKLIGTITSHSHALPTHTHTKSQITDFPTSMPPTPHSTDLLTSGTLGIARGGTGRTDGYAVGVVETRASVLTKIWTGTQAQYDAIGTKDANTLYFIEEE